MSGYYGNYQPFTYGQHAYTPNRYTTPQHYNAALPVAPQQYYPSQGYAQYVTMQEVETRAPYTMAPGAYQNQYMASTRPTHTPSTPDRDRSNGTYDSASPPDSTTMGRQGSVYYTDDSASPPNSTAMGRQGSGYVCLFLGCTHESVFARTADLQRHIMIKHYRDSVEKHSCPVPRCHRVNANGFTRKDKVTDHMRNFHNIDIPKKAGRRSER
ncbi:hypothetical protein LTR66_008827 [Elasticomyces elasticus]|nr:hypothetical protein LTR66_008827 [Elasticomyces elasticus]